ncbi:MAG TPA: hypothetical protein VHE61_14695 [Opitutaceae bacterium]|nr:hypothetical protein [Opitutaceae bacterium]
MSEDFPATVRRLIWDRIPSVERLEVLLLLFEAGERTWSVDEIEQRIRSSRDSIAANVSALVASRLVLASSGAQVRYRYSAESAELDALVGELATAYRNRRVAIIELIYADRHNPARAFSDAFDLRKHHDR